MPQFGAGLKLPKVQLPGAPPPGVQLPGAPVAQPPAAPAAQPPAVPSPPAQPPAVQSHGWSLFRSSSGKTRVDQGNQSFITDPQAGHTIRLDHVKQEAQIIPTPPMPKMPAAPSGSAPSLTPPTAPLSVKDLGTKMIAGHQALGKSYTFALPKPPSMPGMPKAPSAPQAPGMPQAPSAPQAPQAPSAPQAPGMPQLHTVEVWTSPKLQLPLASRVTSVMGTHTTMGKQVTPGEPPASQFQIPSNYKLIPPPPRPPTVSI
jgi:hypothetical protein